jgi:hypothetical protein
MHVGRGVGIGLLVVGRSTGGRIGVGGEKGECSQSWSWGQV